MARLKDIVLAILITTIILSCFILIHVVISAFYGPAIPYLPVILTILAINSIAGILLLHWHHNILTRIMFIVGVIWMGIAVLSLFVIIPLALISLFVNIPKLSTGIVLTACICAWGLFNGFNPKIKNITIKIKKPMKPLRVVQLSDIHIGEIYGSQFLRKVVKQTNTLKPDVVAITGDLFDGVKGHPGMLNELKGLKAPALFISGNHEVYGGFEATTGQARDIGLKMLDNSSAMYHGVQFVGMAYDERQPQKTLALHKNKTLPAVLLRHLPEHPEQAIAAGFDVQLSGHTHHGQIWPLSYLVLLQFPLISGLYQREGFTLYVSQGVGTWGPPFRIGSRSEISCITLESA